MPRLSASVQIGPKLGYSATPGLPAAIAAAVPAVFSLSG
jgi:hypothetical protein